MNTLSSPPRSLFCATVALLLASVGCSSSSSSAGSRGALDGGGSDGGADAGGGATTRGLSAAARQELVDKGVNQYFGKAKPVNETTTGNYTSYEFDKADGPICLWGDTYRAQIRDKGSDNLVIYLEGGGACWTSLCAANTTASGAVPEVGILDDNATTNVVADWNVVYVPYCDGSVFSGDNELQAVGPSGSTQTRYHHGLKNLSAAIDLAKSKFPNPKRILLAGSSAGGYGTIIGTGVVRLQYPDAELMVFNDAGLGLSNPTDPTMYDELKTEWKFDQFIPDSCTECASGQQTALIGWGLKNDPSIRTAAFSSYGDAVIGTTFLKMQAADFKALLLEKTGAVHDAFPTRFERFFVEGVEHTTLILDQSTSTLGGYLTPVDGVSVSDWTKAFVDGTSDWTDRLQNGGK